MVYNTWVSTVSGSQTLLRVCFCFYVFDWGTLPTSEWMYIALYSWSVKYKARSPTFFFLSLQSTESTEVFDFLWKKGKHCHCKELSFLTTVSVGSTFIKSHYSITTHLTKGSDPLLLLLWKSYIKLTLGTVSPCCVNNSSVCQSLSERYKWINMFIRQ